MDQKAQKYFDQIFKEQHEQLMAEIQALERRKWNAIRKKMLNWLSDNGYLPKK
jgi:hypothetical protein